MRSPESDYSTPSDGSDEINLHQPLPKGKSAFLNINLDKFFELDFGTKSSKPSFKNSAKLEVNVRDLTLTCSMRPMQVKKKPVIEFSAQLNCADSKATDYSFG